jgi:hypothetical protein
MVEGELFCFIESSLRVLVEGLHRTVLCRFGMVHELECRDEGCLSHRCEDRRGHKHTTTLVVSLQLSREEEVALITRLS